MIIEYFMHFADACADDTPSAQTYRIRPMDLHRAWGIAATSRQQTAAHQRSGSVQKASRWVVHGSCWLQHQAMHSLLPRSSSSSSTHAACVVGGCEQHVINQSPRAHTHSHNA